MPDLATAAVAFAALLAMGLYLAAAAAVHARATAPVPPARLPAAPVPGPPVSPAAGRWPWWRTVAWVGGVAVALTGVSLPAHSGHMTGHLLTGMVAPVLLVLAAPGTLALRALPVAGARRLTGLLRHRAVRVITHPGYAAGAGTITLWLLYGTPGGQALLHDGRWHLVLHAHLFVSGFLLAWSVAGRDPAPHRPGPAVRAVALGVYMAAHAILAKQLYAAPPPGMTPGDAMLMYYGGDLTHLALVVLVCHDWYRTLTPRPPRRAGIIAVR